MGRMIAGISDFISKAMPLVVAGSVAALLASEVRLAALKKASHGSSSLSGFTAKTTKNRR